MWYTSSHPGTLGGRVGAAADPFLLLTGNPSSDKTVGHLPRPAKHTKTGKSDRSKGKFCYLAIPTLAQQPLTGSLNTGEKCTSQ